MNDYDFPRQCVFIALLHFNYHYPEYFFIAYDNGILMYDRTKSEFKFKKYDTTHIEAEWDAFDKSQAYSMMHAEADYGLDLFERIRVHFKLPERPYGY